MSTPALAPLGDFTSIPIASQTPQMIWAGVNGSSVLLANQDLNNAVTIARRPSFAIGAGNTANVPALGSLTVDGSKSIWGLAPAGTADLLVLPGGSQWAPSPAQVAAQISALGLATFNEQVNQNTSIPTNISTTGVPLLSFSQTLVTQNNVGIAPGASQTSAKFNLSQISFELVIVGQTAPTADPVPYILVSLMWFDQASGLQIDQDTFVMIVGGQIGINVLPHVLRGPCKGNQVQVYLHSYNTTVTGANITYTLLQNSRIIELEQLDTVGSWQQDNSNWSTGVPTATRNLTDSKALATFANSALGVGATDTWVVFPHNGPAWFDFTETGVSGANMAITAAPQPPTNYGNTPWIINDVMVSGNPNKLQGNIQLPMGPVQWTIKNNGSVTASYSGGIVAQ